MCACAVSTTIKSKFSFKIFCALKCSRGLAPTAAPTRHFFDLTFLISEICCSMVKFLCITPIPPSLAIAIAILDSVTVSMADVNKGIFRDKFFDRLVDVLTSDGSTCE